MKKFKSILALLLLGGLVATGCGDKNKNSNEPAGNSQQPSGEGSPSGQNGGGNQQGGEGQGGQQGGEGGGQQGGEGGGQQGHEVPPENSRFVNKKLKVDSVTSQPSAPTLEAAYANGYISLFSDGTCEFVSPHDDIFDVLFGTFTVNELDNVASVHIYKIYLGEDNMYFWSVDTDMEHLNIEYANDQFTTSVMFSGYATTLTFTLSALPNPPMHIVGDGVPEDPNGDSFDAHYQVEENSWNTLFKNGLLLSHNFTVTATVPGLSPGVSETYTAEWDARKVHISYQNYPASEQYFFLNEFIYENEEVVGINCDVYSKNGDEWVESDGIESYSDRFQDFFGLLPISFMSTSYSEFTNSYSALQATYFDESTQYQKQVNNFKASFEGDGIHSPNIKKIIYKDEMQQDCEFNFSAHGTTHLELPEVGGGGGGGGHSQDIDDYYAALSNTQFIFDRLSGSSWDEDESQRAEEVFTNGTISLFANTTAEMNTLKTIGMYGEVVNTPVTQYGSFVLSNILTDDQQKEYVSGNLIMNASLMNGEYQVYPQGYEMTYSIRFYIDDEEIRLQVNSGQYMYFSKTNNTPTPTAHPDPVFVPYLHHGYGEFWSDTDMPAANGNIAEIEDVYLMEDDEFAICIAEDTWLHYEDYIHEPDTADGMISEGSATVGGHNFYVLEDGYYDIYVNNQNKVFIVHETSGGGGGGQQAAEWPGSWVEDSLIAWGIQNDIVPECDNEGITEFIYFPNQVQADDPSFFVGAIGGDDKYDSYLSALDEAGYEYDDILHCYKTTNAEIGISVAASEGNLVITVVNLSTQPVVPSDPCIDYYRGGDEYFENLNWDDEKNQFFIEGMYFEEADEFVLILGEDDYLFYESFEPYKANPDTANGKITEGTETMSGYHAFYVEETGYYDIYINSSNEVYIVHGPQVPSAQFMMYGSDLNGWEFEALSYVNNEWVLVEFYLFADTELVFKVDDNWYHYSDYVQSDPDKGKIANENNNLKVTDDGYYSFYINNSGKIYVVYVVEPENF